MAAAAAKKKSLLDDDWANFCSKTDSSDENDDMFVTNNVTKYDIVTVARDTVAHDTVAHDTVAYAHDTVALAPTDKCSSLYISTQTKIEYLNMPIDLYTVFWKIPILPYHIPAIGVVKKQMKFNSMTQEQMDNILHKSAEYSCVEQHIINQIINPEGRIKFKDVRKVSIGLCKKDITSYRCKKKSAFYNCFVVILRVLCNDMYKEVHVKVFNTGKLEIPGIQNADILQKVLNMLVSILRPIIDTDASVKCINFLGHKSETVLINSNFSCGYFINREKMYEILKYKYKINSAYDPCSYPGIQCEFYYNNKTFELTHKSYDIEHTKVSFMIFRTGSVLIVGKCTETILYKIYDFLCTMLIAERIHICDKSLLKPAIHKPVKNKKGRKTISQYI
jgi:hypothetical protein